MGTFATRRLEMQNKHEETLLSLESERSISHLTVIDEAFLVIGDVQ